MRTRLWTVPLRLVLLLAALLVAAGCGPKKTSDPEGAGPVDVEPVSPLDALLNRLPADAPFYVAVDANAIRDALAGVAASVPDGGRAVKRIAARAAIDATTDWAAELSSTCGVDTTRPIVAGGFVVDEATARERVAELARRISAGDADLGEAYEELFGDGAGMGYGRIIVPLSDGSRLDELVLRLAADWMPTRDVFVCAEAAEACSARGASGAHGLLIGYHWAMRVSLEEGDAVFDVAATFMSAEARGAFAFLAEARGRALGGPARRDGGCSVLGSGGAISICMDAEPIGELAAVQGMGNMLEAIASVGRDFLPALMKDGLRATKIPGQIASMGHKFVTDAGVVVHGDAGGARLDVVWHSTELGAAPFRSVIGEGLTVRSVESLRTRLLLPLRDELGDPGGEYSSAKAYELGVAFAEGGYYMMPIAIARSWPNFLGSARGAGLVSEIPPDLWSEFGLEEIRVRPDDGGRFVTEVVFASR